MYSFNSLGFITIALCVGASSALYKKWVPNTNFDNPLNWDAGRLPCQNDAIKFPETVPAIYIQMNATVQEIVLPMNGQLVLSDFMSLSFPSSPDSDSSCIGQDMEFTATDPKSWYDPDNWCEVSDPDGSCMSESQARLDTERLPCQTDTAVFPSGATFLVELESGVDIHLGKLIMNRREYSTGNFRSYISNDEGRKIFHQSGGGSVTSVNIAGKLCSDVTGCPCGNDGGILEDKVCELQEMNCPDLMCVNPVLPEGHCCHMCGSVLRMVYGPGFKLKSLESAVYGSVSRDMKGSVKVMVSRLESEEIQVVVEDIDGSGTSGRLATIIKDKVQPDETGFSRYRIQRVKVETTDIRGAGGNTQAQTGSKKWGGGSIASLVVSLVAVIVIIIVAMYCFIERKRPSGGRSKFSVPLQWPFRRFSEDDRRGLELGPSVSFKDNISFGRGVGPTLDNIRGFDNPTYGDPYMMNGQGREGATGQSNNNTPAGVSTIDVTDPTFVHKGNDAGFSNPLYSDMPKIEDLSYLDSTLKMNPMFSTEGLEEDSEI